MPFPVPLKFTRELTVEKIADGREYAFKVTMRRVPIIESLTLLSGHTSNALRTQTVFVLQIITTIRVCCWTSFYFYTSRLLLLNLSVRTNLKIQAVEVFGNY
jgi:hypothetical protein